MKINKTLLSIFLLFTIIIPTPNFAMTSDNVEYNDLLTMSLEELLDIEIISSTKRKETINSAPSIMYAISDTQIQNRGYKTLQDVLQHVPGWDFDSPHGNWVGQYSYVRGTRALRQILLLVDGVVQNNINDFEAGRFHTYNLSSVKRVEIINGPASALYGANALLGVINIISKKPSDINGLSVSASTTANTTSYKAFKHDVNILYGDTFSSDIGVLVALDLVKNSDDGEHYYDPDGIFKKGTTLVRKNDASILRTVPDDGFDNHQNDYHLKVRLTQSEHFTFGLDYSDMNEGLGSFLNAAEYLTNNQSSDYQWNVQRLSSFVKGSFNVSDSFKIEPKIYYRADTIKDNSGFAYNYDKTVNSDDATIPKPSGTMRNFQQETSRLGFDLATTYEPDDSLSILLGYNYEIDDTQSEYSNWYPEDPNNNFTRELHSLYAQGVYTFIDNVNFLLGGRYDMEYGINPEFMPRVGVVYTQNNSYGQFINKVLYGESFRALATYEKEPNADNPKSAGIKPEKAKTYEYQIIYIPNKHQKYDISLWYSEFQDLRIDGTSAYNLINAEHKDYREQKTWGLQAALYFALTQKLNLTLNYTYTDGENNDLYYQDESLNIPNEIQCNNLIHVAKHKFNTLLNYHYNTSWNYNLMFKYVGEKEASLYDSKFRAIAASDINGDGILDTQGNGFAPYYIITDLTINYHPKVIKNLSMYLKVNNLLDEKYVDMQRADNWWTPYYHPQPGRTITLSATYKF